MSDWEDLFPDGLGQPGWREVSEVEALRPRGTPRMKHPPMTLRLRLEVLWLRFWSRLREFP